MSRSMSDVLEIILARAELVSSVYIGLDDCFKYGDITRIEHETANRIIGRGFHDRSDLAFASFAAKKAHFKKVIKEVRENESMRAR